MKRGFLSSQR